MFNDFVIEIPELNSYFPQEYLIQYWEENEHLLKDDNVNLAFSISATSREKRGSEEHGKDYYF